MVKCLYITLGIYFSDTILLVLKSSSCDIFLHFHQHENVEIIIANELCLFIRKGSGSFKLIIQSDII